MSFELDDFVSGSSVSRCGVRMKEYEQFIMKEIRYFKVLAIKEQENEARAHL